MKSLVFALTMALAGVASNIAPAAATDAAQKKQIEEIVRNYLLENPELLREMSEKLQAKEHAAAEAARSDSLKLNAKTFFNAASDPVAGNPKGDVTLVEFMDYNCSWCKKSVSEVAGLIKSDNKLRVVMKEFPIFGAGSEYAAKAALASVKQGKYWELHQALFQQQTQVTPDVVDAVATEIGLDLAKLKIDMEAPEITKTMDVNRELARSLNIDGTPAFIVDNSVIPGYVSAQDLEARIAAVRINGCKLC